MNIEKRGRFKSHWNETAFLHSKVGDKKNIQTNVFTVASGPDKMASCTSHVLNGDWGVFGSCESYYAGLTSTTPSLAHVTGEDIEKRCRILKNNWTASEVNKYCSMLVNAQNKYWTDKEIPWIPNAYQHHS
jgi:hypothetical protein